MGRGEGDKRVSKRFANFEIFRTESNIRRLRSLTAIYLLELCQDNDKCSSCCPLLALSQCALILLEGSTRVCQILRPFWRHRRSRNAPGQYWLLQSLDGRLRRAQNTPCSHLQAAAPSPPIPCALDRRDRRTLSPSARTLAADGARTHGTPHAVSATRSRG